MSAVCRLLFGRWEVDLTDLGVVTLVDHHVMLKRCFSVTTTETTTTATTTTTQPPTTTTEPPTTVTTQDPATTTTAYLTTITTQDSTTTTETPTTVTTQDSATTTTESLTTLTIEESTTTTTTESPTKVTTQDSTTMSSEVKTPLTTEASATTSLVTDTTTVRTTADDSNDAASVTNDVTTTSRTCADFSCLADTTTVATPPRQDLTSGDVAGTTTEGMTTQHTNQDTTSHQFQVSSPPETMATDKEADMTSSMPFDVVTSEVDTSQRAKSTAGKKETFSFSTVNVSTTTGYTDKPLLCPCKRKVCFIRAAPPQPAELHLIPRKSTHLYQNTLKSVWTRDSPSQLVLAISVMVVTLVPMFLFIVCDFERLERLFGHRKTKAVHSGRI
ncbi:uncharacterized protein [Littorina saxatilis]|uniref:uncharacterized protein n=1 Tax=Littorina saxatilis TaxID=31220 RepID=UPI0038B585F0